MSEDVGLSAEIDQVHWAHEDARPTSLHGNGHASFDHTTVDWSKVTCRLCQSLRPSETRTRRRIREAIESRGHHVISMKWEPIYNGGEMSGLCGGWTVLTDAPWIANTNYGDEVYGLNVEDVLAGVDWSWPPPEPCGCYPEDRTGRHPSHTIKGDPERPLHEPTCRWFIDYHLPWWPKVDRNYPPGATTQPTAEASQ